MTVVGNSLGRPFGAFPRRDYRSAPPTFLEAAAKAPWCSALVAVSPLIFTLRPGEAVYLEGSALALHAGLALSPEASRRWRLPTAGELCGAVLMTTCQGTVSAARTPIFDKLKAHQLGSQLFNDWDTLQFRAVNRQGELWVWPAVATERVAGSTPSKPTGYHDGEATHLLIRASDGLRRMD